MLLYELVDVAAKLATELKLKESGKMHTEKGEDEREQQKKKPKKTSAK
jgi:hypothetical protein